MRALILVAGAVLALGLAACDNDDPQPTNEVIVSNDAGVDYNDAADEDAGCVQVNEPGGHHRTVCQ